MVKRELEQHLRTAIGETNFPPLGELRRGKVRDIYDGSEGMFLVATDRVSAFDRVITTIPFKGFILTAVAKFWFERTTHIVKNHLIDVPHPNIMRVKKLKPFEVEMVVRGYITGVTSTSLWTLYHAGGRVIAGNKLLEGLRKNQQLPEPIVTPSTKAAAGMHDETVSPEELVCRGVLPEVVYKNLSRISIDLFDFGTKWCRRQNLILVDTKYEFGLDNEGEVTLMDEIHTPDSSRFWDATSYEENFAAGRDPVEFDKEYIRRWLQNEGFSGDPPTVPDEVRVEAALKYIDAYEKITGTTFTPPYDNGQESLRQWASQMAEKR